MDSFEPMRESEEVLSGDNVFWPYGEFGTNVDEIDFPYGYNEML